MSQKESSSELLSQLKLDKPQTNYTQSPSRWPWVLGGVVVCVAAYFLVPTVVDLPTDESAKVTQVASSVKAEQASVELSAPVIDDLNRHKVLDASGYITARQIATVSAKVMGLIVSVDVEEGMRVEKGQVLARIDDTQARINLALSESQRVSSQARLQSLEIQQAEAKRVLDRIQNLTQTGQYSSESQLTAAQTQVDSFLAQIAVAKADIQVAEQSVAFQQSLVDDHIIRAPFAGVVTTKNAQAGEIVAPSAAGGGFTRTGICTIVDMNSLEIQVDVNEAYIGRVKPNQKVEAILDAYPKWRVPASVIAVIPTADRAKATVRVRIKINELNPKILPDMGVKVSFLADH